MSFLLTTNRKLLSEYEVGFEIGAPSGEMGMTSLPVIENRSTYHKLNNKNCLGNKTANINVKNCKFKT